MEKKKKNSRTKGHNAERSLAKLFQEALGGTWSRTPLSGGYGNRKEFNTCGDLITTLPNFPFTVESKNQEGWNLEQLLTAPKCLIKGWWEQTCREAQEAGKKPLLVFTRNHQPYFAMLATMDIAEVLGDYTAGLCHYGISTMIHRKDKTTDQHVEIVLLDRLLTILTSLNFS